MSGETEGFEVMDQLGQFAERGRRAQEAVDRVTAAFSGPPRDPARIEPVIAALRAAWYAHPDLRLGQLIVNAGHPDPFNIEDDELRLALDRYGRQT